MRLRSIEHKIFLLILPICLIPPIIFILLLGLGSRMIFEQTQGAELSNRAKYLADRFDDFLAGKMERLHSLAQSAGGDLQKLAADAALQTSATGVVRLAPAKPGLPLAQRLHIVMNDPAANRYVRWLSESQFFRYEDSKPPLPEGGLFQDMELSIPARVEPLPLLMYIAETPSNERIYFLFEAVPLINSFRRSLPQHPESFHIYSSSGFVPYAFESSDPDLATSIRDAMNQQRGDKRWFFLKDFKKPYLIAPAAADTQAMKRLTGPGERQGTIWSILLTYDMENYLSPLEGFLWLAVVAALGLTLAIIILGMIAARQIVRPLQELKHQAEEIAKGHLDVRAAVTTGDEIGHLAETFNTMAARLRVSYHALEERLEENQLRASHINVINEITSAIVQVLSLDAIFEVLRREMGKLAAFDAMWIALYDEKQAALSISQVHPARLVSLFDRGRIPLGNSIHGHVVDSRETVQAEICLQAPSDFFETRIFRAEGYQSYLIAPLPSRNRIIGTLTIASTAPEAFSGKLTPVMGSLAGAVAVAIEQTRLFQRISSIATELEHKVDDRTAELERANKKLIQTEKYFATGRMAGNLAHEINNPLGIIKNYLRLVENNIRASEAAGRHCEFDLTHLQILNEEVDRIARMVHQMLNLHRPEEQAVAPVDINAVIEQVLALMEQDLNQNRIRVAREMAAGLPRMLGSADLIRQLLINLISNAQDAMEGGGTLTMRTSALSQWSDGAEQEMLRIRISDTGCGIPGEHLSQIFDPFFTTKSPEKGTGLGLCVSYSIVSMYRGTIDVESKVGQGTTVVVTLPVDAPEDEPDELVRD